MSKMLILLPDLYNQRFYGPPQSPETKHIFFLCNIPSGPRRKDEISERDIGHTFKPDEQQEICHLDVTELIGLIDIMGDKRYQFFDEMWNVIKELQDAGFTVKVCRNTQRGITELYTT